MALKLKEFDVVEYLDDEEVVAEYLKASFESRDINGITSAISDITRSRSIKELAVKVDLTYKELYEILYRDKKTDLSTIQKLCEVLDLPIDIISQKIATV